MTNAATLNGLIKIAKEECVRLSRLINVTYSPAVKTAIESVLEMVITKSGNDAKVMELAVKVREALK